MAAYSSAICPLFETPITHPGVLHCGHEFEKQSISLWLAHGRQECPLCWEVCTAEEISETQQEAVEKASRLVQEKLSQQINIQIIAEPTFGHYFDTLLQAGLQQLINSVQFATQDESHLYRMLITRVFTRSLLNLSPLKQVYDFDLLLRTASADEIQEFRMNCVSIYVSHISSILSSLMIHSLMEDRALHEIITPRAYIRLPAFDICASSKELAREFILCDEILSVDRKLLLASLPMRSEISSNVMQSFESTHQPPGLLYLNFLQDFVEIRQIPETRDQALETAVSLLKDLLPFWYARMLALSKNHDELESSGPDRSNPISFSPAIEEALTHVQVEFLLSTLLIKSFTEKEVRKNYLKAIDLLENLSEEMEHPVTKDKMNIAHRLYQILGSPHTSKGGGSGFECEENQSSIEKGRSMLPLVFYKVHPSNLLHAIAKLRTELHAEWVFSDRRDYEQEWNAMQKTLLAEGRISTAS